MTTTAIPARTPRRCPLWRGFNLLTMVVADTTGSGAIPQQIPPEDHFRWLADWGFNFARVCLNYRYWTPGNALFDTDEYKLAQIDRIVNFGIKHGIHISLDIHKAPGKWEDPPRQPPLNLWKDQLAVDAFAFHWNVLARRYRGIDSHLLSFNLLNEPERLHGPEGLTRPWYEMWARTLVTAIRHEDPARHIVIEGPRWARDYVPALSDLDLTWGFHCYDPVTLTHYGTALADRTAIPAPQWPRSLHAPVPPPKNDDYHQSHDRAGLQAHLQPWLDLADQGVPVHLGEFGVHFNCPRQPALAWLADLLTLLNQHDIGFAYWGIDGDFGIIDCPRADVTTIDFHGHRLDRDLLNLLQSH